MTVPSESQGKRASGSDKKGPDKGGDAARKA